MPKEISHRILADRSLSWLKGLQGGSESESLRFSMEAAGTFPCLFRFGATTPDTIFYFAFAPKSGEGRNIADRSHRGAGVGSFNWFPVFKELIENSKSEEERGMIHAYALGILNHLAVDYIFHPLVRHFAPAERAHHLLEMHLDLFLIDLERKMGRSRSSLYLKDIVQGANKESPGSLDELFCHYANSFVNSHAGEQPIARDQCRKTAALHCRIQKLFFSPLVRQLLRVPSVIFPERVGKYRDLFYQKKRGERFIGSLGIEELERKATDIFLTWVTLFNDYLEGKGACPAGPDVDRGNEEAHRNKEWESQTGEVIWSYTKLKKELHR